MSTIDSTMTDPADEQTHSEADLATIGDVTVWHQMPHLSARRLIQLNCKTWSVWHPFHNSRIVEARRLDDTRDWYFPIITKKRHLGCWRELTSPKLSSKGYSQDWQCPQRRFLQLLPVEPFWSWTGIWHESAHHASERALTLPPICMAYLPLEWLSSICPCNIVASAGGLLLIVRPNLEPRQQEVPNLIFSDTSTQVPTLRVFPEMVWRRTSLRWRRLLVWNPLTKECRELPAANCRLMGWPEWDCVWNYGVQTHMVVNDEANSYKVVLFSQDFVTVYSSITNSWNSLLFPTPRPWALHHPDTSDNFYCCSSTHVGGRHFFADVMLDPDTNAFRNIIFPTPVTCIATLRTFEVDIQAGTWHLLRRDTLRKFQNRIPSSGRFSLNSGIIRNLELVGCMGDLYAVFPARLHDVLTIEAISKSVFKLDSRNRPGEDLVDVFPIEAIPTRVFNPGSRDRPSGELVEYMPLVFFVMQLLGDGGGGGVDHAELRIPVPQTMSADDIASRKSSLIHKTDPYADGSETNWFDCEARGNVIWLSFDDYLLSYDVVSRESTMQIIPLELKNEKTLRLAYRPSFHMKP